MAAPAEAQGVSEIGYAPDFGQLEYHRFHEHGTKKFLTTARVMTHGIENSNDSIMKWTDKTGVYVKGTTDRATWNDELVPPVAAQFDDGMQWVPYFTMRAAMLPRTWKKAKMSADCARPVSMGFKVVASDVDDQRTTKQGDVTVLQAIDVKAPIYYTWDNKWGKMWDNMLYARETLYNNDLTLDILKVNDDMTSEFPETWEDMLLKTRPFDFGREWAQGFGPER